MAYNKDNSSDMAYNKEKKNITPDILRILTLKGGLSTTDIARHVYKRELNRHGENIKHRETAVRNSLNNYLVPKGLVKFEERINPKNTPTKYYSLSHKGSIIALKYFMKKIAPLKTLKELKNKSMPDEFRENICNIFNIKLNNPLIEVENNNKIITIKDEYENKIDDIEFNIKIKIIIDLDEKRGILNYSMYSDSVLFNRTIVLLIIKKDGIYALDISIHRIRTILDIANLNNSIPEDLKRYLVKEYNVTWLNKAKIEKEDNNIIIKNDKERIVIEIDDESKSLRLVFKNKVREFIKMQDLVGEVPSVMSINNPFYDLYIMLSCYTDVPSLQNNKLISILQYMLLAIFDPISRCIIIDGIVYGLEKGIINEYLNEGLITDACLISIMEHIRFYSKHDMDYIFIFFYRVTELLAVLALKHSRDSLLDSDYPYYLKSKWHYEYILNTLFNSIFKFIIDKYDIDNETLISYYNSCRTNMMEAFTDDLKTMKVDEQIKYLKIIQPLFMNPIILKISVILYVMSSTKHMIRDNSIAEKLAKLSDLIKKDIISKLEST